MQHATTLPLEHHEIITLLLRWGTQNTPLPRSLQHTATHCNSTATTQDIALPRSFSLQLRGEREKGTDLESYTSSPPPLALSRSLSLQVREHDNSFEHMHEAECRAHDKQEHGIARTEVEKEKKEKETEEKEKEMEEKDSRQKEIGGEKRCAREAGKEDAEEEKKEREERMERGEEAELEGKGEEEGVCVDVNGRRIEDVDWRAVHDYHFYGSGRAACRGEAAPRCNTLQHTATLCNALQHSGRAVRRDETVGMASCSDTPSTSLPPTVTLMNPSPPPPLHDLPVAQVPCHTLSAAHALVRVGVCVCGWVWVWSG